MKIAFCGMEFEVDNFPQYQDIRHAKELSCECNYSSVLRDTFEIIGYCDTQHGYMAVFECSKCFEKYRYHINTTGRYNIEEFKKDLGLMLYLQNTRK